MSAQAAELRRNRRTQIISTRLPVPAGVALSSQLLPGIAYTFEYNFMVAAIRTDSLPERDPKKHSGWRLASREKMQAPLLLIYLISGDIRDDKHDKETERPYRSGLMLPALGLHFPGKEDASSKSRLVRYRLNRVAQAELFPVDLDDDEQFETDADPDD